MNAKIAHQRSQTYANLAHLFSEAPPGLESEFTRLFLGPGRPVAHPFESVYREGRMMGECASDVRRRLAEEGLAPPGKMLPDHVATELAFMAHLAAQEAEAWEDGDVERARSYLAQQDRFLRDHLLAWIPQFCHRVLVGQPHAYYADLTRRMEAFVAGDAEWVGDRLGKGSEAAMAVDKRVWWAVSVSQGCTLCAVCIQVCRPGALQLQRKGATAILHFDPTACDGCAACQRWCPEGIIDVLQAAEPPSRGELARSKLLACPRCGRLYAPATMVSRVQAQMGLASEMAIRRLILCPDCKAAEVSLYMHTSSHHGSPLMPPHSEE